MVLGVEFLQTPAMAPPSPLVVNDQNAVVILIIMCGPSDHRSTARIRRYRFGGCFAKETLHFSSLEPVVQNVKWEYVFLF
jgi:hypothetical protein